MATYAEIFEIGLNTEFRNKVVVAVAVKADAISSLATPTQLQIDWAKEAYANPILWAERIFSAILAANKGATVAQILAASDTAIQSNVDDVIDNIYTKTGA